MFSFKTLEEKYRSVPDDVREAISSSEVNKKLRDLTEKYKLQLDQAEELTNEIGFVMLGLKPSDDFIKNIQKATGTDYKTANQIAEDANNIIFKDIRESLKQIHSKTPLDEQDAELETLGETQIRAELIKEIENPTAPITDLVKLSDTKQVPVTQTDTATATDNKKTQTDTPKEKDLPTETPPEQPPQSTQATKQNPQKNYIIDPYREKIE